MVEGLHLVAGGAGVVGVDELQDRLAGEKIGGDPQQAAGSDVGLPDHAPVVRHEVTIGRLVEEFLVPLALALGDHLRGKEFLVLLPEFFLRSPQFLRDGVEVDVWQGRAATELAHLRSPLRHANREGLQPVGVWVMRSIFVLVHGGIHAITSHC
jgi:hypothetical protein